MLDIQDAHHLGANRSIDAIDFSRISPQALRVAIARFETDDLDRLETDIQVFEICGRTTATLTGVLAWAAEAGAARRT